MLIAFVGVLVVVIDRLGGRGGRDPRGGNGARIRGGGVGRERGRGGGW